MENRKTIWSDASVPGLILGLVPVAYFFINMAVAKMPAGIAQGLLSALAWIVKFVGCIWLFKFFMKRFASDNDGVTNSDTFRFGVVMALYSAFLVAAFQLLYFSVIDPDYLSGVVETALQQMGSQLDSNSLSAVDEMLPKMPAISFFSTMAWCFLFGLVLSAIFSRKIPSDNPFD